jgi:hypothetical protein
MKLQQYREEIEKGEAGLMVDAENNPGAAKASFRVMAFEIRCALWQPGYKTEALELAQRAENLGI